MTKKTEKLKAIADETRLRILNLFIRSGNSLCVCELVDALKLPQYHISKHLIVLRNAGYFQQVREGTWVYYKLDNSHSENKKIFSFLKKLLDDEIFEKDFEQLNRRLILREDNKCVIGFVDESELLKLIDQKEKV